MTGNRGRSSKTWLRALSITLSISPHVHGFHPRAHLQGFCVVRVFRGFSIRIEDDDEEEDEWGGAYSWLAVFIFQRRETPWPWQDLQRVTPLERQVAQGASR